MTTLLGAASGGGWADLRAFGGYMGGRSAYVHSLAVGESKGQEVRFDGIQEVESLRRKLLTGPILEKPAEITVRGTLFPCVLLSAGWWERRAKDKLQDLKWRDPLQAWLFHGFEQWGPSWDVSLSVSGDPNPYLFAQLGTGDEVDSLLIIIPGQKARLVRDYLLNQRMPFEARITGSLLHRRHLSEAERSRLGRWGRAFDYCLRLDEDNQRHAVSPLRDDPEVYSGYLWQCLAPKDWVKEKQMPQLTDVFFIWEHTDFTKPDAVKYNLDSLQRKEVYLESRFGNLLLLQKSSILVPGDPAYPSQEFYNRILQGGDVLRKSAG